MKDARSRPRRGCPRAPEAAPSTGHRVLDVLVELKKREQVRTPAHQLPAPPSLAQILAAPGPVECMCTRRARAAGRPLLFAGMTAVATPPMRRRQRRFTTRPPCGHPSRHAQLQPTAPLTMCARDRCQAAGAPLSSGESSPRCSFPLRKALRAALALHLYTGGCSDAEGPRAAVWTLPTAAAAAARLGGRPQ